MAPRAAQGPPRVPKTPKIIPKTTIFFDCGSSFGIIVLDLFEHFPGSVPRIARPNKKKFTIVAPSFQSIRVHLSQAEYPEPPNTIEKKRNSGPLIPGDLSMHFAGRVPEHFTQKVMRVPPTSLDRAP